ncbi:leucine Rich Repeat domain protein [Treponema primitia ZAS-2]|uniref:Leucine Rich Repeat domain protein n=1 Tax=Treponema primitia (strain ATCC BAA-887 / DSM 12427 / ZAS-2) TaxID=545694 RepID=F5YL38_TREPZ|nr:FliG C-terminal domain-containing protein [Treponema primitia]AEF85913.1 leucine Rich Repeat domain protein [Treponema primitia ZAS-2]
MWFDDLILALDDRALQRVFREVDLWGTAVSAFTNTEPKTVEKICRNFSPRIARLFRQVITNRYRDNQRLDDQVKIESIVRHLSETGEIIGPKGNFREEYQAAKEASLLAQENKRKEKDMKFADLIEAAVNGDKILKDTWKFTLKDIQLGFDGFKDRQGELEQIKGLKIQLEVITGAILLFELGCLESLDIDGYVEKEPVLPESIGKCINLKRLSFPSHITEIPEWVRNFTKLESLDFNASSITVFPEWLWELQSLKKLTMGNLSFIPDGIEKLTELRELDVSYGTFTSLPEGIGKLTALTKLSINNSNVSVLPDSIGNLRELVDFSLYRTEIRALPETIGNLSKLSSLNLRDLHIQSLPESIGNLSGLTSLDLSGLYIQSLPKSIGNLSGLHYLSLKDTKISALPDSIGNFTNLTNLNLEGTEIDSLTESIGKISSLKSLSLKKSKIKNLPNSIGNLASLAVLDLSYTNIETLPDGITGLSALEILDLGHTKIKKLPDAIGTIPTLYKLILTNTEIRDLPDSVLSNDHLYIPNNELVPAHGSLSYDDFIALAHNVIMLVMALSKKARREGLLALEEEIEDIHDEYFKTGLLLVVDGTDAEIIRPILTNYLEREHNHYRKILRRLELEGILGIQAGDSPTILSITLNSIVRLPGRGFTEAFTKYLDGDIDAFDHLPNMRFYKRPEPRDREEVRFICRAMEFSDKSRREGLLALEELLDRRAIADGDLFEYGIVFVIDGFRQTSITEIFDNMIEQETDPVKQNLSRAKKAAVLSIQQGDSPRFLFLTLFSFFDEEIRQIVEKEILPD